MDASTMLSSRAVDDIGPGPYPDVTKIPTPPLQMTGVAIMFALPALATVIFGLRVYTRITTRTVGVDDYLCGLALVSGILVSTTLYMFFKLNYYGWPDAEVPEFDPSPGLWWNFFEQLCYNPVLALVKASILVFLLRLGGHHNTIFKAIWTLMIVNICHAVSVFFGALFQCVPIKTNWNPELRADPNTFCIDNSFHIIQSAIAITTDILILALPFWIFLGLRMPRAQKWAVLFVFAIGAVVPIVAIVRIVNMYRLLYLNERAKHYNIAYVWTPVECHIAIIACCMPALRPLFSRLWPRSFGSSGAKAEESPYSNSLGNVTYGGSSMGGSHQPRDRSGAAKSFMLKDIHGSRKKTQTEIRDISPSGSEEEIMGYNGILRTTNVNVKYEEAKRSEAVAMSNGTSSNDPRWVA